MRQNSLRAADQFFHRQATLLRDAFKLPLDLPHHAAHARTQGSQRLPNALALALVLLRVRVAADLARQTRRLSVVVLPQRLAMPGCSLHQMFPAAFHQARISGMSNGLLHHRRIDNHALQARALDDLCPFGRFDRLRQQFFTASLAQPLAPARQARRTSGGRVCRYVSPVNTCQYGFSSHCQTTSSSDRSNACCKYSSPAIRRGEVAV
ncbi:hypothetical protein WI88_24730 [Burkholderia ubonensis]|nr:hypothetical protein WI88_24730 [Burkholderia ubonensis]